MLINSFLIFFIIGLFLNYIYFKSAKKFNIIALIKDRSLHDNSSFTGAGAVFAIPFLIYSYYNFENFGNLNILVISGLIIVILVGIYDDIKGIKPYIKLISQFLLSLLIIFYFRGILNNSLFFISITCLAITWYFNMFNFIDGSNGFAAINFLLPISTLIIFNDTDSYLNSLTLNVLFPLLLSFLIFNLKGRYFMGETGSYFLSFILLLNLLEYFSTYKDFFILLIIFNYIIIDTNITIFYRLFKTKFWYKEHRGHAYQNFSRIYGHNFMLIIYILYFAFILIPSLYFYKNYAEYKYISMFTSIAPTIVFCLTFGIFKTEKRFFYEEKD